MKQDKELTDDDFFLFGKAHAGKKMADVPVSYLHWFWHNVTPSRSTECYFDYIKRNLTVLKSENEDLIWKKS